MHAIAIPSLSVPASTCDSGPSTPGIAVTRSQRTVKTASSLRGFFVATTQGQREYIDDSELASNRTWNRRIHAGTISCICLFVIHKLASWGFVLTKTV